MFCLKCGTQIPDGGGFCPGCGAKIEAAQPVQQAPQQPVTQQYVQPAPVQPVQQQPAQQYAQQPVQPVPQQPVQMQSMQQQYGQQPARPMQPARQMPPIGQQYAQPNQGWAPQNQMWNQQPGTNQKKSKKGLIIGLIVGFTVLILAGVGLFVAVKFFGLELPGGLLGTKNETVLSDEEKNPEIGYSSGDNGLSFRYPQAWTEKSSSDAGGSGILHLADDAGNGMTLIRAAADPMLYSYTESEIRESYGGKNVEELLDFSRVDIGGVTMIKSVLSVKYDGNSAVQEQYFYNWGDFLYGVIFTCTGDYEAYAPVFDSVMETYAVFGDGPAAGYQGDDGYTVDGWYGDPEEGSGTENGYTDDWNWDGAGGTSHESGIPWGEPESEESGYVSVEDGVISRSVTFENYDFGQSLTLNPDGSFALVVNLFEGMGTVEGKYEYSGGSYYDCYVTGMNFKGFRGDDVEKFSFRAYGNTMEYYGDPIGALENGMLFYQQDGSVASEGDGGSSRESEEITDLTGYSPSVWSWLREGEGYGISVFTSGKYVRTDGRAVLYIESSDSTDFFSYLLYVMPDNRRQSEYAVPFEDDEYNYSTAWWEADRFMTDWDYRISFEDLGDHVIYVGAMWGDDLRATYPLPDGKYVLVREK